MKPTPQFDIDLDKHYNATVVIACTECGHETRHHLKSLQPGSPMRCKCGADISMTDSAVALAQRRVAEIKQSYRLQ
ncbi:hypothetical protein EV683_10279 [Crenobacter luteus]|uniref:Uncharacterized protein n=1 Tax=Crenobacter luteus TaxID=1452487 RepID=A0A163DB18_9NEIS|nr:hypothetical protein [Crenobacter luteus]KZE34291.1 hypothetical protein AVW16_06345 [Crenobacter luteus]TCP15162.1 hypothetical protein EV683_10279 [Crenobacter luteus]